jgi:Arm DNA-binding domain
MQWTEGTNRLKDTVGNRKRMEARAVLISEEMEAHRFDYLKWFPNGNKADEFRPKDEMQNQPRTVGEYFRVWIEGQKPPAVRKAQERDFRRYILPKFDAVRLTDVSPRRL